MSDPPDDVPRRPCNFWSPFNLWWRKAYEANGRRPCTGEIDEWYESCAAEGWPGSDMPSLAETKVHAKCMRSTASVREYFRKRRAAKRGAKADAGLTAVTEESVEYSGCSHDTGSAPCKQKAVTSPAKVTNARSSSFVWPTVCVSATKSDQAGRAHSGPSRALKRSARSWAEPKSKSKPKVSALEVASSDGHPNGLASWVSHSPASSLSTCDVQSLGSSPLSVPQRAAWDAADPARQTQQRGMSCRSPTSPSPSNESSQHLEMLLSRAMKAQRDARERGVGKAQAAPYCGGAPPTLESLSTQGFPDALKDSAVRLSEPISDPAWLTVLDNTPVAPRPTADSLGSVRPAEVEARAAWSSFMSAHAASTAVDGAWPGGEPLQPSPAVFDTISPPCWKILNSPSPDQTSPRVESRAANITCQEAGKASEANVNSEAYQAWLLFNS